MADGNWVAVLCTWMVGLQNNTNSQKVSLDTWNAIQGSCEMNIWMACDAARESRNGIGMIWNPLETKGFPSKNSVVSPGKNMDN